MLQSTFNPGLTLSGFRTPWPWLKISVIERTLVIVLSHINLVLVLVNKLIITLNTQDRNETRIMKQPGKNDGSQ